MYLYDLRQEEAMHSLGFLIAYQQDFITFTEIFGKKPMDVCWRDQIHDGQCQNRPVIRHTFVNSLSLAIEVIDACMQVCGSPQRQLTDLQLLDHFP